MVKLHLKVSEKICEKICEKLKNLYASFFSFFFIVLLGVLSVSIFSCVNFKKSLDRGGIEDISESILKDFQTDSKEELTHYIDNFQFITNRIPPKVSVTPLKHWLLDGDFVQEKIEFQSLLPMEGTKNKDIAYFHLYRNREATTDKVILWIPGFAVSDFAFRFIKDFFYQALSQGYAVLFYNIPFHLKRIPDKKEMGQGLFRGSLIYNLEITKAILWEIEVARDFLKTQGLTEISGWGGSIGATYLWLSSHYHFYQHLTLMIPNVNWDDILFHPIMQPVIDSLSNHQLTQTMVSSTYQLVSPLHYPTMTSPANIQILYGKYDQLIPPASILEFSRKWQITHLHEYEESHASILLNDQMYLDNLEFLKKLKK